MKIVADENMPGVETLFGSHGEILRLPGRHISAADVRDADVLLVRSITAVNQALLAGSRVGFVGSATIGTDHVEGDWLAGQGIAFANAPGCNAVAVADYVIAGLCVVRPGWLRQSVAIVGCGNVGGGLYRRLKALGVDCRCYDPFLDPSQNPDLCDFDHALEADILCLHTPLTRDGPYPTWHLFNADVLDRLKPGALLLNAGRGEVVDNRALLARLTSGRLEAILDVWEHEPAIDLSLLRQVRLGTPHIAGYSVEGKWRGTAMVYEAFCRWQQGQGEWVGPPPDPASREPLMLQPSTLAEAVLAVYDPRGDDQRMRDALLADGVDIGVSFDRLRKTYPARHEFGHYTLPTGLPDALAARLRAAGFRQEFWPEGEMALS